MDSDTIFIIICCSVIMIMILYYMKRERKILSMLFGALTGMAALFILNKFNADIPLNIFNLSGSAILGAPFVAGLVLLKYI
ncbi:MAG: pro-sigmaK processing inhibitor BofA family protein [Muribaculaceae bacterium]|nr:pro-sigmaK processing inhibitor BofA family protein [Alistipes senegalensis]MCM1474563.1 pro-sigmaK processing inhibitor BofA family protein [Muribaculaceae bacterium]MDE6424654.1 pro-sigmaK processing inhibitor BofA family protein [Ruminococcus sp.]